ncbi:MAG: MFS transporter [Anaerolineales bacterium]|nr:MFS transporter [Anaerolineales bacterium]
MKSSSHQLLNRNLRWFLLAMILANIAGQMAYSMLALYLVDLGASVPQVGLVFTVASLVPMALQLLGGWISDTIGRLRAIAIGSSIAVIGYLLFLFSPSWEWIMVGLCVEYVSNAFVGPSFGAYVAEQSDEAKRGQVFGITKSIYMIVSVIGPTLAGFLAYRFSFRWMLLVAFGLYAMATCVRVWMATAEQFAPTRAAEKPTLGKLKLQMGALLTMLFGGGLLTWIWITDAINDTTFNLIGQLYPIYLADIGLQNIARIGLLNGTWGLASILASLLSGRLSDRIGERRVIAGSFLIVTLSLVSLMQARGFLGFALAMFLYGFGIGGLMPAYDSLISKAVPEDKRGLAFGFFGTSLGILSLPFPWIGAQLWERFGPQTPFWITTIACAISSLIVWLRFSLPKKGKPELINGSS